MCINNQNLSEADYFEWSEMLNNQTTKKKNQQQQTTYTHETNDDHK